MRIQAALVGATLALAGCTTTGSGGLGVSGPSGGAARPAPAVASTIIAEMEGGLIGQSGIRMSDSDRQLALQAEYRALEYTQAGEPVKWQGGDPRSGGEVVAAQPYRVGSQDCRQYTHTFSINGPRQSARGTACRNPDGSWTPLT